ncbi:Double-stranded RNA-binding protein 2 [Forsythia ovata]|uniref:Double-stranded RNA-binding protein 2 n=1 Tax=Forsythia ovata TaxID=205694 RepID=A0ABD1WMJ0_9LAMI
MYKNQLQELAQRSCFNLPSYTCIREGPDHAPRFKATVNFNGDTFESPNYCSTLRQAEHSAAEVALNDLSTRGPTNSLAARILDETGVYKNLLQEVSQRVGSSLPAYTTFRSGLGHLPVFTGTVELAGVIFTGEPAKNKKQAEKNAAMSAWLSLKSLVQQFESSSSEKTQKDELEHMTAARALQKYLIKAKLAKLSFPIKFPTPNPRPSSTQQPPAPSSKILPFICPKPGPRNRPISTINSIAAFPKTAKTTQSQPVFITTKESPPSLVENDNVQPLKFPAARAAPYIPVRHCNPHHRIAPPVTIRNAIPVFSTPPLPPPQSSLVMRSQPLGMAPPVCIRQAVPVFNAPPVRVEELPVLNPTVQGEDPQFSRPTVHVKDPSATKFSLVRVEDQPVSIATSGKYANVEVPSVHVEQPMFEVPDVQVESPVSLVTTLPTGSKASADKTMIAAEDKLPESKVIEDFEKMKI